jgi:DNA repair protein RecO (recombination protein O)
MYYSTRGIVFRQTKYSDTSLVVRILTEEMGLRSYIIKGARGPKAKIKASLFQPLTLLELIVSQKEKSDLQHIREARVTYPYQSIHQDIRKSSILLFLDELLYKSIQEEAVNAELTAIFDHLILLIDQNGHFIIFYHTSTRHLDFSHGRYLNEILLSPRRPLQN